MSAQIVDPNRYKKTTRKKSVRVKEDKIKKVVNNDRKERKLELKLQKKEKNNISNRKNIFSDNIKVSSNGNKNINYSKINKKISDKLNNKVSKKNNNLKYVKAFVLVLVVVSIVFLSRNIVKKYNDNTNTIQSIEAISSNEKNVSLMQDSILKIGVAKLDSTNFNVTRNVILNEIYRLTGISLIEFDNDYNIKYELAKKIEKASNKEYVITLNKDYKIECDDVLSAINDITKAGDKNIYFTAISNISKAQKVDSETIRIELKNDDPYFVFALNFPVIKKDNEKNAYNKVSVVGNEINFSRNSSSSNVKDITLKNYDDIDNMIEDFRNNKIDVFTASSDSIMSLVGKHDYSIKKYRNGNTLFLLGNKKSSLFSKKEIRKAILYSIDRDQIIRNLNDTFLEKIDLPFIYSKIKYKYDEYGVQNALSSQGWVKSSGVYTKKENDKDIKIELNLVVNADSPKKVKVAEYIKEALEKNGMKLNINALKGDELNNAIKEEKYDLVLANVDINEIPDITFMEKYLNINDITNSALNIFKNSDLDSLTSNFVSLQDVLSGEIACIGLYASNTNVVYQTNIAGFDNISYMKIFNNFDGVGKMQDIEN